MKVLVAAAIASTLLRSTSALPDSYFGGTDNQGYLDWLSGVSYNKSIFIASDTDPNSGVAVHWDIINDSEDGGTAMIQLAVVAKATGWSAFGLAEAGAMRGADIVTYTAATKTLTDTHVLDQLVMPITDACPSDWELIDSSDAGEFIMFEAQRLLNTGDTQDRVIIDDGSPLVGTSRVIVAWGDSEQPSFHGNNAARGSMRFFGPPETADFQTYFAETMVKESEGNFTLVADNFIIPSDVVTTYEHFCISKEELIDAGVPIDSDLHAIGFEPYVHPGNSKYVHHFVVSGSESPWNKSLPCLEHPASESTYGWAPGGLPQLLPSNVGSPLGSQGFQSFSIQIHYDNVDLDVNISDSSGVRIYYTSVKRQFDSGVFSTGDPGVVLTGSPVTSTGGLSQHTFSCEGECLGTYLDEPVTVIEETLHMHKSGVSMQNIHIRNGQVIRQAQVDYWDFPQQGAYNLVQPSYQLLPGDSFRTVCNYNSENPKLWGIASDDEMCMASITYYPRKTLTDGTPVSCGLDMEEFLPGCGSMYNITPDFSTSDQLDRSFGTAPSSCPNTLPTSPQSPPNKSPSVSTSRAASATSNVFLSVLIGNLIWSVFGVIS